MRTKYRKQYESVEASLRKMTSCSSAPYAACVMVTGHFRQKKLMSTIYILSCVQNTCMKQDNNS